MVETALVDTDIRELIRLWSAGRNPIFRTNEDEMSVIATVMDAETGKAIQKMKFGRMPRPYTAFVLESGARATIQRVEVGKPAPGKFVTPVEVWVSTASIDTRQP